eukprot:1833152-Prymnesium_polylepis.1
MQPRCEEGGRGGSTTDWSSSSGTDTMMPPSKTANKGSKQRGIIAWSNSSGTDMKMPSTKATNKNYQQRRRIAGRQLQEIGVSTEMLGGALHNQVLSRVFWHNLPASVVMLFPC